jgi:hypothetical protein
VPRGAPRQRLGGLLPLDRVPGRRAILVYLTHQAAFNTAEHLQLRDFLADTREIGRGIIVGQGGWQAQIEANKAAFFRDFVTRPQFVSLYQGMTNAQYVDALNANTGGSLTQDVARRARRRARRGDAYARARAARRGRERGVRPPQFNRAFVLMQYFGYLRRNPNDPPQRLDFEGYNFWLGKLNEFNGDFVAAEMVKAFITSDEYNSGVTLPRRRRPSAGRSSTPARTRTRRR